MSYIPPHLRVSQDNKPKPTPISEQTMPYIPPHLRLSQGNRSKPTPATPSSSSQNPHLNARTSKELLPDGKIYPDFIYRFILLLHHEHMSSQHVKFTRFEGETYTHYQRFEHYTLTELDPGHKTSTAIIDKIRRNPANVFVQALQEDLKELLEKSASQEDLKELLEKSGRLSHAESCGRLVPIMWLRFGRLLFQVRRGDFDWGSSYSPESVESNIKTRRLSKIFDTCLSKEEFAFLKKLAHEDALHIRSKERVIIQVADEMRPRQQLWCICSLSEHNEQRANACERDYLSEITVSAKYTLVLKKVKLRPLRHMIGDVACVGKSRDIRLAFFIQEYLPGLTEEELCDLKSSFSQASADGTSKGGLQWPLDSMHSTSGRFKVVGSLHEAQTVVIGGGLKWCLQKCDGIEFNACSERITYKVSVKPIICQEFCKGREEWNTEKVILSIEELLQRIWADYI